MSIFSTATIVIMILDNVHDILCPFFKDNKEIPEKDLNKILEKLQSIENEIKLIKHEDPK